MFLTQRRDTTVQSFQDSQLGAVGAILPHICQTPLRDCLKLRFVEEASTWTVHKTLSPFNRRVTAIEWHPVYHNVVAFASHGGDIQLWCYEDPSRDLIVRGLGYGYGCITSMKFHPENPRFIYATSVAGRFYLQDFEGRQSSVYLDTQDIAYWWCCTDICRTYNVLFVGDNTGNAAILDSAGETVCKYRKLHKGKIKYSEFCPTRSWLLATASVDHTVALWDIRMLRSRSGTVTDRPVPISTQMHGAPVNSASFDPQYGSRLLTTAQNSELRVYDASNNWEEPTTTMTHPHRHYQHMTDIVATWHPIHEGLCVVGRYPGKEDSDQNRCVDLIDVVCGERVGSLHCPTLKGIVVLNKFDQFGSRLASGMGYHCLLWQPQEEVLRKVRSEWKGHSSHLRTGTSCARLQRKSKKRRKTSSDHDTAKKKLKRMSVVKKKL